MRAKSRQGLSQKRSCTSLTPQLNNIIINARKQGTHVKAVSLSLLVVLVLLFSPAVVLADQNQGQGASSGSDQGQSTGGNGQSNGQPNLGKSKVFITSSNLGFDSGNSNIYTFVISPTTGARLPIPVKITGYISQLDLSTNQYVGTNMDLYIKTSFWFKKIDGTYVRFVMDVTHANVPSNGYFDSEFNTSTGYYIPIFDSFCGGSSLTVQLDAYTNPDDQSTWVAGAFDIIGRGWNPYCSQGQGAPAHYGSSSGVTKSSLRGLSVKPLVIKEQPKKLAVKKGVTYSIKKSVTS